MFLAGFELPRINYDINGKRHRFVYGNCVEHSVVSKQVRLSAHNTRFARAACSLPPFYWAPLGTKVSGTIESHAHNKTSKFKNI